MNKTIDRYRNVLIFPALSLALFSWSYYTESLSLRLFLLALIGLLISKEEKKTRQLCLILLLIFFARCQLRQVIPLTKSKETQQYTVKVISDTIKVNGDSVSFSAKQTNGQKVVCYYQVQKQQQIKEFRSWRTKEQALTLHAKSSPGNEKRNWYAFDQKNYFKFAGIAGALTVTSIDKGTILPFSGFFLSNFRGRLINHIQATFASKTAGYLLKLLLGFSEAQFDESEKSFEGAGVLHLLSISGMHVSFFLGGMDYVLRRSRWTIKQSFYPLQFFSIVSFFLTGGSAATVKALCSFSCRLVTRRYRIQVASMDLFAVTVLLLLFYEPLFLHQTGGLLTVGFTFCFLFYRRSIAGIHQAVDQWLLSCLLLPFLSWFFLMWYPIAGIIGILLVRVFFYLVFPLLLLVLLLQRWAPDQTTGTSDQFFMLIEKVLLPFQEGSLIIGQWPLWLTLAGIGIGIWMLQLKNKKTAVICSVCLACFFTHKSLLDSRTMVTFIDVGQGDSIFLKAPSDRENMLIDTGGQLSFPVEEWRKREQRPKSEKDLIPYLKGLGVRRLDYVVLTHNDADHVGELDNLMRHIKVKMILIGWGSFSDPNMQKVLRHAAKQGTKVKEVRQGMHIGQFFDLEVVAPWKNGTGKNEDSVVLRTRIQQLAFLFMGDLNQERESQLIKKYPKLKADVLKVGHHGSRTSTGKSFLQQIEPTFGVISCGEDNRFGHPHQEIVQRLHQQRTLILRTDQQGAISFFWYPWQKERYYLVTLRD